MYFPIAVIKLSESKFPEKNCKFETLYFGKSLCDKSESLGDNNPSAFETFAFLKITSHVANRTL